ncbi:MAG: DUF3617 family protein [Acidobacteriota bacterium]|nr:DUF3617 family protein [Acidobacteriota bacterium]
MKKVSGTTNLTVFVTAIAMTLTAASLSAADRMRVGQWELVSTGGGQTRTHKACVGAAEAGAANGDAKASRAFVEKMLPASCKFTDYRVEGNSITSTMACGSTTVHSVTRYHGDGYESESTTKVGGASEAISHINAKRLGDCP